MLYTPDTMLVSSIFAVLKTRFMAEGTQYFKDRIKFSILTKLSGYEKRLKTGMQQVLLQLESKKLLPDNIHGLEMFGMHGLWHTRDYVSIVQSLDIFEINKAYHTQSKKVLKGFNVSFYNADSIKYVTETYKNTILLWQIFLFRDLFMKKTAYPCSLINWWG